MPRIEEIRDLDLLNRMGDAASLHGIRVAKELVRLESNGEPRNRKLEAKAEDLIKDLQQVTAQIKKIKEES